MLYLRKKVVRKTMTMTRGRRENTAKAWLTALQHQRLRKRKLKYCDPCVPTQPPFLTMLWSPALASGSPCWYSTCVRLSTFSPGSAILARLSVT